MFTTVICDRGLDCARLKDTLRLYVAGKFGSSAPPTARLISSSRWDLRSFGKYLVERRWILRTAEAAGAVVYRPFTVSFTVVNRFIAQERGCGRWDPFNGHIPRTSAKKVDLTSRQGF